MPGDAPKRYPPELKERAVRMVAEVRANHESDWAAMTRVSELLGVGTPETVRKVGTSGPGRRWRSARHDERGVD